MLARTTVILPQQSLNQSTNESVLARVGVSLTLRKLLRKHFGFLISDGSTKTDRAAMAFATARKRICFEGHS